MRVEWSTEARDRRDAIWLFLAERSVSYADRVEDRINARIDSLKAIPLQVRPISGTDLRQVSIPDIQYVIHYRIEDEVIRIMRVFGTRQNRDDR